MTTINVPYMDYFDRQTLAALTAPPVVEPEPEPQPQDDWSCATDGDLAPTGEWVTFKVSADIKPPRRVPSDEVRPGDSRPNGRPPVQGLRPGR
jgi:hypothetical protein